MTQNADLDFAMLDLDPRTAEQDDTNLSIDLPVLDQYGSRYLSTSDASRVLGVPRHLIDLQLAGDIVHARGYRFTFGG